MATPTWITIIGLLTKLVLVLLVFLSIWSVSIMIDRKRVLEKISPQKDAETAREFIRSGDREKLLAWANRGESLQAVAMKEALTAPQNSDAVAYSVKSFLTDRRGELNRGLSILATLGSNAPFIGLFGTVLGIIQSFGALATSGSAMNDVIFSLAEALIATAVGLFVAIPAVVSYNVFSQKIKNALSECESLRDLYLSRFVAGGK